MKISKPNFYLPFAGTYTLNGKLAALQELRGVPNIDEAYDFINRKIKEDDELGFIKSIKVNPDNVFDLEKKSLSPYVKFDELEHKNYISKSLSSNKLSYETNESVNFNEIFDLAKLAHKRYLNKLKEFNIELSTDILLEVLDKYIIISNLHKKLNYIDKKEFKNKDNYVIYKLDIRLLKKYSKALNLHIGIMLKLDLILNFSESQTFMIENFTLV